MAETPYDNFSLYGFFTKGDDFLHAEHGSGAGTARAVGVVAEYDPFHLGHQYLLARARRLAGADLPVVCAMSGSWTQRGGCALTDKWTRARLALRGGVDLVLELPVRAVLSSAEGFARGAVALLKAAGVVDILAFGSECGDIRPLRRLARCLESPACQTQLRRLLKEGMSFARCRQEAVRTVAGEELAGLLSLPNNNLGVEYLRALHALGGGIRPLTVRRQGALHGAAAPQGGFASASRLRTLAREGDWVGVAAWTPEGTARLLRAAGISKEAYVERAMLSRLKSLDGAQLAALPDSGAQEGLPARLLRAARAARSMEEFYALAKTRRYTLARLRRLAVCAFLGIQGDDYPVKLNYLRVLGANDRGAQLLKTMKKDAKLPLLTKPAHIRRLDAAAQRQFELECKATDLYGMCFPEIRPGGLDFTVGPVILGR